MKALRAWLLFIVYAVVAIVSFCATFHFLESHIAREEVLYTLAFCGSVAGASLAYGITTGNFFTLGIIWAICWKISLTIGIPAIAWKSMTEITWKVVITAVVFIIANLIMMWIEDMKVRQNKCPFNL